MRRRADTVPLNGCARRNEQEPVEGQCLQGVRGREQVPDVRWIECASKDAEPHTSRCRRLRRGRRVAAHLADFAGARVALTQRSALLLCLLAIVDLGIRLNQLDDRVARNRGGRARRSTP